MDKTHVYQQKSVCHHYQNVWLFINSNSSQKIKLKKNKKKNMCLITCLYTIFTCMSLNIVKPVLRGHKKMWPYETGDLLKEVQFI